MCKTHILLLGFILLLGSWALAAEPDLSGDSSKYENKDLGFLMRIPREFKQREGTAADEVIWDGPTWDGISSAITVKTGKLGSDPRALAEAFEARLKTDSGTQEEKIVKPTPKATGVFWGYFSPDNPKLYHLSVKWYFANRKFYQVTCEGPFGPNRELNLHRTFVALMETFNPLDPQD